MSLLIALLIVLVLSLAGFLVGVTLLKLKDPFAVLGLTFVFGAILWVLLANWCAYILPIRWAFLIALVVIGTLDIVLLRRFASEHTDVRSLFATDRTPLLLLLTIIGIVGFANVRFLGSDPWSWQHFPLAATIAAKNFPVMNPIDPLQPLAYHYAPAFLAAGFHLLAKVPLTFGFGLQPLIGGAGILCFAAAFVRRLGGSVRTALIAAILALAGGGLMWLKGPELFALFQTFILQTPVEHAVRGIGNLVASPLTTSPLVFLGHRSTAMGFPLLYGLLWSSAAFLQESNQTQRRTLGFVGFLFALGLTLTMELAFITVSFSSVIFALFLLSMKESRPAGRRMILFGALSLLPALLIGLVHGGVLSHVGGGHSFSFTPSFSVTFDTFGSTTAVWSVQFLRDFGLPLLLFPLALVFSWRRRHSQPAWLLLCILGLVHFLLPFFFEYEMIKGEMRRSFYGATSIFSLFAGVAVMGPLLQSDARGRVALGWIIAVAMLLSGTLYLVLRIAIPTGRLEPGPLVARMPVASSEQQAMYEWVRDHTTKDDYFYIRNLTVNFEELSDEEMQMRDRVLFMTYTGRFTIGPIIFWDYSLPWLENTLLAENDCSATAMQALHVRYLVVETQERAIWFRNHCRSSEWSLRYDGSGGERQFPRIYELTAGR